jgi:1-acyl-sn-glycerol-3-phosphate acyltransferase
MKFFSGFVLLATLLRCLIGHLIIVPWTAFVSILVVVFGSAKKHEVVTDLMAFWSKSVLWLYGVEVNFEGLEKLPHSGGAILLFNHQSHFDIPAVTAFARRRIRFGAKIELYKIPFFGSALKASGCLPIARENRVEVLRIYEEAGAQFHQGVIFALAPEGTRQSTAKIGPFKKGPFIFATRSQVPVVPVVIEGADRVMPKSSLLVNVGNWKRTIHVRAMNPIYPEKIDTNNEAALTGAVGRLLSTTREIFVNEFDALRSSALRN